MAQQIPFLERLKTSWRILIDPDFAAKVQQGLQEPPPERAHASGLILLASMQREGRLVDFLRQEVAGFSDEDIGAAARIVHGGCQKVLKQFFDFDKAVKGEEGAAFAVPNDFDAQRIRLTGNVTGQPPFKGTLKHHGWIATSIRMPQVSGAIDPRVVAPAEVELP